MFTNNIFNIYVKQDLASDNQQWLICHKTKPNLYLVVLLENVAINYDLCACLQGVFSATKFYKVQKMLNETIEVNKERITFFWWGYCENLLKEPNFSVHAFWWIKLRN